MDTHALQNTLTVSKTARYYTLGTFSETTQEVWVVLHGYAQLASDFLIPFSTLNDGFRYIIAPEGLNKFYAKGLGGKPAATWMTSEMREQEIADYISYLDLLYQTLGLERGSHKIMLLGFSQGVATATRWLHHTSHRIDELIVYAGEVAAELRNPVAPKLLSIPITYVTGNNDRLISPEKLADVRLFMQQLNAREIVFDGGHEVKAEVLKTLLLN
jgi:predicted esterase